MIIQCCIIEREYAISLADINRKSCMRLKGTPVNQVRHITNTLTKKSFKYMTDAHLMLSLSFLDILTWTKQ